MIILPDLPMAEQNAAADAWKKSVIPQEHFTVQDASSKNKEYDCNWCHKVVKGTSRCVDHLCGKLPTRSRPQAAICRAIPEKLRAAVKAAVLAADKTRKDAQQVKDTHQQLLTANRDDDEPGPPSSKKAKKGPVSCCFTSLCAVLRYHQQLTCIAVMQMDEAIKRAQREKGHKALMQMIVREGLPIQLVRARSLQHFIQVVQSLPAGYTPPAYDSARTVLLDKTVKDVERDLEPWGDRTRKTGASITSDGWSDTTNRPLLNMLAVNAKGAKFVDAINTEGQQKTAEYIAKHLEDGIELVGPEFVVQVITDNAANCKAAGAIIEGKYPGIFWSPCVAHVCDLALEDIFKAEELSSVHIETKEMIKFIKCVHMLFAVCTQNTITILPNSMHGACVDQHNHLVECMHLHMGVGRAVFTTCLKSDLLLVIHPRYHHATLAAWRLMVGAPTGQLTAKAAAELEAICKLELVKPGETRFATAFTMLERLLQVKPKAQQFVVHDSFTAAVSNMQKKDKEKAEGYKELLLSSEYWRRVTAAVTLCEPLVKLLRLADSNTPSTGKIHYYAAKVSSVPGGWAVWCSPVSSVANSSKAQHAAMSIPCSSAATWCQSMTWWMANLIPDVCICCLVCSGDTAPGGHL